MSILVVAEHDNKQVKPATFSVITAASQLGENIRVLVAGHQCSHVATTLQSIAHVEQVLLADDHCYEYPLAESLAPLIVDCAKECSHVLAPANTFGKNILPRAAVLMDVGQVSDIIEIIDEKTYCRPIYAGNAIAEVKSDDPIQFVTVRPTAFNLAEKKSNEAKIVAVDFKVNNEQSKFLNLEIHGGDRPELSIADIVISGGRGLQNEKGFQRLMAIADRLGAAVGASRAAVDAGYAPNDFQVGQTGQVVAPKLYIAVGISGAIQHLAGMQESKIIVAINKDEEAPIFQIADYGLVADLTDVLPQWEEVLTKMGY